MLIWPDYRSVFPRLSRGSFGPRFTVGDREAIGYPNESPSHGYGIAIEGVRTNALPPRNFRGYRMRPVQRPSREVSDPPGSPTRVGITSIDRSTSHPRIVGRTKHIEIYNSAFLPYFIINTFRHFRRTRPNPLSRATGSAPTLAAPVSVSRSSVRSSRSTNR